MSPVAEAFTMYFHSLVWHLKESSYKIHSKKTNETEKRKQRTTRRKHGRKNTEEGNWKKLNSKTKNGESYPRSTTRAPHSSTHTHTHIHTHTHTHTHTLLRILSIPRVIPLRYLTLQSSITSAPHPLRWKYTCICLYTHTSTAPNAVSNAPVLQHSLVYNSLYENQSVSKFL